MDQSKLSRSFFLQCEFYKSKLTSNNFSFMSVCTVDTPGVTSLPFAEAIDHLPVRWAVLCRQCKQTAQTP